MTYQPRHNLLKGLLFPELRSYLLLCTALTSGLLVPPMVWLNSKGLLSLSEGRTRKDKESKPFGLPQRGLEVRKKRRSKKSVALLITFKKWI